MSVSASLLRSSCEPPQLCVCEEVQLYVPMSMSHFCLRFAPFCPSSARLASLLSLSCVCVYVCLRVSMCCVCLSENVCLLRFPPVFTPTALLASLLSLSACG